MERFAFIIEFTFVVFLMSGKSNEALGKILPVGTLLTEDQLSKLCKFDKVSSGYNVCQKVSQADGTPDYQATVTLELMCDAVREALGFQCARCLAVESPEGSNFMVDTCALSEDCQMSLENETAWMYLTTQKLKVEIPVGQKCDGNGFKVVHEECSAEKKSS